jgi:hypothetical protein
MIKALKKLRIEGMFLNIIKAIYDKPHTKWRTTGIFPIKLAMRQKCPLSPLLFNIVLEFLSREI